MTAPEPGFSAHATAILVGEHGILIRGPAGAGKSTLARDVLARAGDAGRFAALVSDDRVRLSAVAGRVIASAASPIAGILEIRGMGLVRVPYEPSAVLRLIVDLDRDPPRMPEPEQREALVAGVSLPRISVNPAVGAGVVLWTLGHLRDAFVTVL